jgi:hypothetical protein
VSGKRISQREARRLRKRVEELERHFDAQRHAWSGDWPGGVNICTANFENLPSHLASINTARLLGHAVVAVVSGNSVRFHALPLKR